MPNVASGNQSNAEHAEFIRALGECMFLQRGRLTNFVLREGGEDLLEIEEGSPNVPPVVETCFGGVVRTDRRRHGTEENTPGTRVLPESASRLGGKVSSRDQFGPFRQRRRSLGKPYAPKDTRRPTVETKSKAKRQVPSHDPEESYTEDEEPETSRTLGSSSQDSLVPRKKKKASPAQSGGRDVPVAQSQPPTSIQQSIWIQQPARIEPSVQNQSSKPIQPSTSAGRTAIQAAPSGPRRIAFQWTGR